MQELLLYSLELLIAKEIPAGFSIICMSYGYNHGEDIRDYDPDAVVDSMAEIKNIIAW